jgi:predicted hydrocarbon binding protein
MNEFQRMQKLAGLITESEYKSKIEETSLKPKEQEIFDDIISTLNEGAFNDVLGKVKDYAKKGLITVAIVASLLGGSMLTSDQKQDVVDVVRTEMPVEKNPELKYISDAYTVYSNYNYNKEKIDSLAKEDSDVQRLVNDLKDFDKKTPDDYRMIGQYNQKAIEKIASIINENIKQSQIGEAKGDSKLNAIADLYAYRGIKSKYDDEAIERYGKNAVRMAEELAPRILAFMEEMKEVKNKIENSSEGKMLKLIVKNQLEYDGARRGGTMLDIFNLIDSY